MKSAGILKKIQFVKKKSYPCACNVKKLAAILLLVLFLFNIIGYRIVFYFVQQQDDIALETSLDKDQYDESELITIKVPLSLPYQTDWKDFERVDGEMNLDGKIYKYVKRKVQDGQLVLMCLPDEHKMRIQNARDEFFKLANDLSSTNSSKKSSNTVSLKNVLGDYEKQQDQWSAATITYKIVYEIPADATAFINQFHNSPEQPPEC
jgi:hypothetical protein